MTDLRFRATFVVLIALSVTTVAYAWAPGECQKTGASAARCCEHEAYWCHGGSGRALNHCHYCQELCISIPSDSVCVWGGTWPGRRKKCHPGVNWFKVCASIPNDASLGGGAYDHVDRAISNPASTASLQGMEGETLPVNLAALERVATEIASRTEGAEKLVAVDRERRNAVTNQIAFVISLMGEVLSTLRSALASSTVETVKNNMNRAISSLGQLITQARELINLIPSTDRGLFRTVVNRWISAIRVIRVTLQGFVDDGATVDELKESVQAILDELARGFWTRASVALNGYAAFGRFNTDWAPWINAIARYFQG